MPYPNSYREGPPYELYGDPEMYLKWRGPLREAARIQVLNLIAPVYGAFLAENDYELDDALNKSKMWQLTFGGAFSPMAGQNLLELAEIYEASLNVSAIHEQTDFVMADKMQQFVLRAQQINAAGLGAWANLDDLVIPENLPPEIVIPETETEARKSNWLVPVGLILTALSFLG